MQREPETEPRWTSGLDAAELAGVIGARYRDLAQHDPAQTPRAVRYIGQALLLRDASRQRNRAFDLIGLARVHLIIGEPEQGAALIGQCCRLRARGHLAAHANSLVGVSCLVRGADQLFARVVLELGGALEVVLPRRTTAAARSKWTTPQSSMS